MTGHVPSLEQMQDDLEAAEIRQEPRAGARTDTWKIQTDEDGKKWLLRVHTLPCLALFTPSRTTSIPMDEHKLTGKRVTTLKVCNMTLEQVVLEDNYKTENEPNRPLQDRWLGETRFESSLKPLPRPLERLVRNLSNPSPRPR